MSILAITPSKPRKCISATAMALIAALAFGNTAHSETGPSADGPSVDPDRKNLNVKIDELKQTLKTLNNRVTEGVKQVEGLNDPKNAEQLVSDLEDQVNLALSQTADNGTLATTLKKVLETYRGYLATARAHGYNAERLALLENGYTTEIDGIEHVANDITNSRHQLTALLKMVQEEHDYLSDLARIQRAHEMVAVLNDMLAQLREATQKLQQMINATPGV